MSDRLDMAESGLWAAIKRLKAARRKKADARMVAMLEARVKAEADKLAGHITLEVRDRIVARFAPRLAAVKKGEG